MRQLIIILSCILYLSIWTSKTANAQPVPPNCPPSYAAGFDITGDSISLCLDGVSLTVTGNSTINTTSSYSVNNIPYAPYPWVGANQIFVGTDDIWGDVINLPFNFCYFGQKYDKVVIGANGQVCFDPSVANTGNAWSSSGWVCPINNVTLNNCIMAPYHDVNPGVTYAGSKITWDIYGTYPCRYMVVSWDSVPMFSCTAMHASQQVVLFESTYLIDINIKEKPLCSTWNGGVAHQGIQNANGTTAFMVPGRNGTQWTANNDSYRFTPNGAISGNFLYWWIDVATGDTLGTGPTLSSSSTPPYNPTVSTKVTVHAYVVTDCDTITAFNADTINVIVTGIVNSDFQTINHLGCVDDTVELINNSTSTMVGGNPQYFWDFGDGTNSTLQNPPPHVYLNQGTYPITLTITHNGCVDTSTQTVDLNHPINAQFTTTVNGVAGIKVCLGDSILAANFGSTPANIGGFNNIQFNWNWGDGTSNNTGYFESASHIYPQPGFYNLLLTITDTLGCIDTMSKNIFVEATPYNNFTISDDAVCVGQPVYFADSMDAHHVSFNWNFDDGNILSNVHNPSHVFSNSGIYNVVLTTDYQICPSTTSSKTISVEDFPSVNLGADTSICPGLTGSILLTNTSFATGTYLWNTNETTNSILVNTPGYYWLKVTSSTGECSTTDTLQVLQDCYLNIPNSFSPNGDGLNDYFLPREILSSGLAVFKMSIYNRWGEKIYFTDKTNGRGWDGKYNNVMQPLGVYVYIIDAVFDNGVRKNFKGNVTLLK